MKGSSLSLVLHFQTVLILITAGGASAASGPLVSWGGGQQGLPSGLGEVTAISSSLDHSLALLSDGSVVAWGNNFDGQCNVPSGLQAKAVAAGAFFSAAVKQDGTVVAWGDDQWGQCRVPARLANAVAISSGRAHSLALRSDGSVVAWGSDIYGQCDVPPLATGVRQVVARWNYSLALRNDGAVIAWGVNDAGQTNVPAGLNNVVYVDGNESYCLAVKSDGTVVMWGQGPGVPGGLNNVVAVAAGDDHALALRSDGSVVAWGGNEAGQQAVPNGTKAQAVAAGWRYSLAIGGSPGAPGRLTLFNPRLAQQGFAVSFDSQSGRQYSLEYKESSTSQTWSALPSVSGTGNLMSLVDPAPNSTQRFYRVRQD